MNLEKLEKLDELLLLLKIRQVDRKMSKELARLRKDKEAFLYFERQLQIGEAARARLKSALRNELNRLQEEASKL